jgi:hypothetical protein
MNHRPHTLLTLRVIPRIAWPTLRSTSSSLHDTHNTIMSRPEGYYAAYDYWSMCSRGQQVRYYGPDWLGTSWDHTAALRSIGSWRDSTEHLMGARRGPDQVGPGRLTCYSIGTTASAADPRGIFYRPILGWPPEQLIRHSTRRTPRPGPFGGAGQSSEFVRLPCGAWVHARWRTRKRTISGGPSGAIDT